MARSLLAGLAVISVSFLPLAARGDDGSAANASGNQLGGWNQLAHRNHVDFYRNNSWPEPFLSMDRMATRAPFCIQTDNGWKMQNTIGNFLFDAETQRVNQAGDLLVKWILTQAPAHRRAYRRWVR